MNDQPGADDSEFELIVLCFSLSNMRNGFVEAGFGNGIAEKTAKTRRRAHYAGRDGLQE